METSPLTKELYSIDWATRFEQYQKYEKANFDDLYLLLSKIEETVEKNLSNKNNLDTIVGLRTRLDDAKPESPEWHFLSMLVYFRTVKAALPKGLTATATLSAIHIMGHMWQSLALQSETEKPASTQTSAEKPAPRNASTSGTSNKNTARSKPKSKSSTSTAKPRKTASNENTKTKTAAKQPKRKENPVTENVVIKKLTAETGGDDDQPLAVRCHDVANSLADEYPQYTLTAIRVMTAEKLGVTRQYVENLDIKPARFK